MSGCGWGDRGWVLSHSLFFFLLVLSPFLRSCNISFSLFLIFFNLIFPCIFGKKCFDMLKSIGFRDFLRVFSSLRRSDRVYLG